MDSARPANIAAGFAGGELRMSMNPLDFLADLLFRWRSRTSTPLLQRARELELEVSALSLLQAKRTALELLEGGRNFRTVRRPAGAEEGALLTQLPTELSLLLQDFASIELLRGDQRISRDDLGPSVVRDGFLRVGRDIEFAEVVVRPGDEAIYVLVAGEEPTFEAASVFHWLILLARLINGAS